jgi:hypothetical protein
VRIATASGCSSDWLDAWRCFRKGVAIGPNENNENRDEYGDLEKSANRCCGTVGESECSCGCKHRTTEEREEAENECDANNPCDARTFALEAVVS